VLRKAVVAINRRVDVEAEKKAIAFKATLQTLTFEYLSPLQCPFTDYENTVMLQFVRKYTTASKSGGKALIRWKELTSAWLARHHAERESQQMNRLSLRAEKVLRSHYQTLSKAATRACTSSGNEASGSESEDATALTTTQSSTQSTSSPASSPSPSTAPCDTPSICESDHPHIPPPHPSPPPSSVLPPLHSTLPPLPPPPSTKWSEPATVRFNQLCAERGYRWDYQTFNRVWPHTELGEVSHDRWSAKNRIERDKRKRLAAEGDAGSVRKTKRRLTASFLHGGEKRISAPAAEE
jgi:hypothetical protein